MRKNKEGDDFGRKPFHRYKLVRWRFHPEQSKSELRFFREHGGGGGSSIKYLHLDHCTFSSFSDFEDLLTRTLPNLEKLVWSVNARSRDDFEEYDEEDEWDDDDLVKVEDGNGVRVMEHPIFLNLKRRHDSRENFQRRCKVLEIRSSADAGKKTPLNAFRRQTGFWTRLFYCMPAVQDVTLRMNESEILHVVGRESLCGLVDGLKLVTRLHGGSNIRKLDIMDFFAYGARGEFGGEGEHGLIDLPALEELSIDWGTAGTTRSKHVLTNVSTTLQVLKAFRAPIKLPRPPLPLGRLPPKMLPFLLPGRMELLRELHLYGNVTGNLTFLRFTPNLQVLVMSQFCFDKRHKMKNGTHFIKLCKKDLVSSTEEVLRRQQQMTTEPSSLLIIVPSLTYLQVDYPVHAATVPTTLAKWLPNVKTVKMVMDNELLSATCKAWPKLEDIECLYRSEVGDDGVSSLIHCPELRKYKMNALCGQATLMTSSSLDTFVKINSLRELDICISDQRENYIFPLFNADEEAKLLDKLTSVKLISRNNDHHHDNLNLECCEWKAFFGQRVWPRGTTAAPPRIPTVVAM